MEVSEIQGEAALPEFPERKKISVKGILSSFFIILLGCTFIFSGASKLFDLSLWAQTLTSRHTMMDYSPFDQLQWSMIDVGITNQFWSGILARLMVGVEFALGGLLLFRLYLSEFTYKAVMGILAFFTVYLLFIIIKRGNTGDCGCFGNSVAMTPVQAIAKNIGMMAMTWYLMRYYKVKAWNYSELVIIPVCMGALVAPFLINMIDGTAPVPDKTKVDMGLLYKYPDMPHKELREGKQIVAFMSLTCHHCRKAAFLLSRIQEKHPEYNFFMVLVGSPDQVKGFLDETKSLKVPHILYAHTDEFMRMAGPDGLPSIYWMNNGVVEYKSKMTYYQLDPAYMEKWFKTNQPLK